MKKIFLCLCFAAFLLSCNNEKEKTETSSSGTDSTSSASSEPADLPYKASYSSNFTTDVSDADLKMVLNTYKDWSSGNIAGLEAVMADSVDFDASDGMSKKWAKADLSKFWKTYRDSLSSVTIDMYAWQKMYEPTKKEGHVVTWYKEIDTYKDGRVDSATYHDINGIKDGKMVWYSSMKRGFKKSK